MTENTRQIVIVGSGPAGLTAAIYAARAGLKPLVIEGATTAGGALMTTTEVENFPGFPDGIQGPDLMLAMRAQALKFGAEIVTDDVTALDLTGDVKTVTDSTGNVWPSQTVILAMGSKYRRLGIPDEETYSAKGVSWCATCDGFFYRGKHVAVVGGGDAAVEEATFLTRFASKVTLIHRRDALRASEVMIQRLMANPAVEVIWNTQIVGMTGDGKLDGLTLRRNDGTESHLAVDGLFEAIGSVPQSELVAGQVNLDEAGFVTVSEPGTNTSLDGVFACGDLVDHIYRQAIVAAGSGCRAAIDAERWLAQSD
ncbi:MAG: thioredoxin-disulfide reductase [Propionibacteriaceae bacterium]|nr:thioredoxin-disulfide reductase [Propionibacteriaceae bacterium]